MLWRSNEVHMIIWQSPLRNEICVSYTAIGFFFLFFFPEEVNGKKNKDANNNKSKHIYFVKLVLLAGQIV